MIQIIIGTNRPDSKSLEMGRLCQQLLLKYRPSEILSLTDLNPSDILNADMYEKNGKNKIITDIRENHLIPSTDWIIILPEYNGSFPGILKLLIDVLSVERAKETFYNKKVGLIGVSSGRAGNLRGLDQLTSILHYLHVDVMPFKLPISSVNALYVDDNNVSPQLADPLEDFIIRYLDFIS
jgi:chromate reductase